MGPYFYGVPHFNTHRNTMNFSNFKSESTLNITNTMTDATRIAFSITHAIVGEARFALTSEAGHRAHDCAMDVMAVIGAVALEVADTSYRYAKAAATNAAISAWEVAGNSYYTQASVRSIESAWEIITPVWNFNARAFQAFLGLAVYTAAWACAWVSVACDNVVKASLIPEGDELDSFFVEAYFNEPTEFPILEPMANCAMASETIVRTWVDSLIPNHEEPIVAAEATMWFVEAFLAVEGGYSTLNEWNAAHAEEVA